MSEPGKPRGPYANGLARRRQIVDEAVRVFGELGYNGGSLRQIAERVGVSPAAINRHFASKDDLLAEVLAHWQEETNRLRVPGEAGLAYLARWRDSMRYHEQHPGLLELFLSVSVEATAPDHPAGAFVRNRYQAAIDDLTTHLRIARDNAEIRSLSDDEIDFEARDFIAFADGMELQFLLDRKLSLVERFEYHWQSCVRRWAPLGIERERSSVAT